jgi:hypothetical protein
MMIRKENSVNSSSKYILEKDKIVEVQTEHIIYRNCSDIKQKFKRLNSGAGFQGFTPNFILSSIRA